LKERKEITEEWRRLCIGELKNALTLPNMLESPYQGGGEISGLWHAWEEWDIHFWMREVKETDRTKELGLDV
jgi:hypothetical protein